MRFTIYDAALKPINVQNKIDVVGDRVRVEFGPFTEKVAPYATQLDEGNIVPLENHITILYPNDMLTVQYENIAPAHKQTITIDYTNHRRERRVREIWPKELVFESSEWHPTPQWVIKAIDMEDMKLKSFPLNDIHGSMP